MCIFYYREGVNQGQQASDLPQAALQQGTEPPRYEEATHFENYNAHELDTNLPPYTTTTVTLSQ